MRAAAFAIAIAMTAGGSVHADTAGDHGVIGGEVTPEGEYPGVGALWLDSLGGIDCTGTLIAPTVVLTAAHCVDPLVTGTSEIPGFTLAHDTVASIPEHTAGMRAMQHEMFSITADPGVGVTTWYDIALVFLAEPITSVDPIRLPTPDEAAMLVAGTQLDLVGYGVTQNQSAEVGVMYDAVAPIVTAGAAELQISHPGEPQNCYGDSGGPALVDLGDGYRVVGVVSRSAGTQECTQGGIDTRVDFYTDWIFTNAGVCAPGDERCPDNTEDGGGCCSTSHDDPTGAAVLVVVVVAGLSGRRRARARRAT